MNLHSNAPIGVFDSGVGGISVLKELVQLMPNEDFIFFGDSKNAPYGTKSVAQVNYLSQQVVLQLLKHNVKAIVIACNTATSAAANNLRAQYPELPIIGLEPAVKPAVLADKNARVLVMATKLTLKEEKFQTLIKRFTNQATIYKLPASQLVEFIEQGQLDAPELHAYLSDILQPYLGKVDSVVLGCTHFPFAKKMIQQIIGDNVKIIDGGNGAARELQRVLTQKKLLASKQTPGQVQFFNSLAQPFEIELSQKLFQSKI